MPFSDDLIILDGQNRFIIYVLSYDKEQLEKEFEDLLSGLTVQQLEIYDEIMYAVSRGE